MFLAVTVSAFSYFAGACVGLAGRSAGAPIVQILAPHPPFNLAVESRVLLNASSLGGSGVAALSMSQNRTFELALYLSGKR